MSKVFAWGMTVFRKIEEERAAVCRLCARHGVRRLSVFGSAVTGAFDPERSDLDFLVEFQAMSPAERADRYFGLLEDLEELFGMPIDLIERAPIRNPFLLSAIEASRIPLYDAA